MAVRDGTPPIFFSICVYFCCAIALLTAPFGLHMGEQSFYLATYLSLLAFILHFRYYLKDKKNLLLPGAMLLTGIITIIWIVINKQPDDYIILYRQYQATGRLQIATAFLLLFVLNEPRAWQNLTALLVVIAGFAVNAYALYQGHVLHAERVELNFDRATIAAYIITVINLLFLKAALLLNHRHKVLLFFVIFILSLATLVMTGTRAAMLTFPVLALITVLATKHIISRKHKIIILTLIPLLIVSCGMILKNKIEDRVNDFQKNIATRHELTGENAIISRLSMQTVALHSGCHALMGESAEKRGEIITKMVKEDPELYGVLPYITVHMHNELLETFSLKGIPGVLALLALYLSLIFNSFRPQRNPVLLAITLSLVTYGLSDVIFYSKEGSLIYCIGIVISILLMKAPQASRNVT
ncbi:ligase [Erwinia sp. OLTSP20]|nr:ligase [Erwinia sp. OAMSP11]PIJ70101.1 ligase [Erwinia sp. OLSSP12]PIJ80598.1 ligase [Erwinia sp. OLCASP19]PIJ82763.1 ligase [Erwinia sp. OLMTSP26]PIJ84841.1 ligase [Erwinia sp. OLMDSP33]PIJ89581.1 ligase [Erwinia sp. OLFS4]PIJ91915.1 ligase [Erwinia sp. OLTSP20]